MSTRATPSSTRPTSLARRLGREVPVVLGLVTGAAALAHWSPAGAPDSGAGIAWSLWLVACILACSFRAMSHADELAERFGEPAGTIILTISAITIEVASVCAVMLGSALSTIGLTVPAVIVVRFITGASPELGLDAPYIVLLLVTFLVAAINLSRGRSSAMQGFVHLLLFAAWIVTILDEASVG